MHGSGTPGEGPRGCVHGHRQGKKNGVQPKRCLAKTDKGVGDAGQWQHAQIACHGDQDLAYGENQPGSAYPAQKRLGLDLPDPILPGHHRRSRGDPAVPLDHQIQPGNAAHGKQLFYGDANCSLCHMVEGKGGRLGPDLTAVGGSRTREAIIESVRNPSRRLAWGLTESTKEFPQEYESVTAVTADGKEVKGVTLNEDSFTVQIMDTSEQIHLLEKNRLRSFEKSRQSTMPKYGTDILSDKDLADIVAYLASVEAK